MEFGLIVPIGLSGPPGSRSQVCGSKTDSEDETGGDIEKGDEGIPPGLHKGQKGKGENSSVNNLLLNPAQAQALA